MTIIPQINLNGSDGNCLYNQYKEAIDCGNKLVSDYFDLCSDEEIRCNYLNFIKKFESIDFHGRDYQVENNYFLARKEYQKMNDVLREFGKLFEDDKFCVLNKDIDNIASVIYELKEIANGILKQLIALNRLSNRCING